MKRFREIIYLLLLAIIPELLPVVSSTAQVHTVYPGDLIDLGIVPLPEGSTCLWDVYCDLRVNFAQVPGNCSTNEYQFTDGVNDQANVQLAFKATGEYMVKIEVSDPLTCTNNMKFLRINVIPLLPTAELALEPNEICVNEESVLTVNHIDSLCDFVIHCFDEEGNLVDVIEPPEEGVGTNSCAFIVMPAQTTIYKIVKLSCPYGETMEETEPVTLYVYPLPAHSRIYLSSGNQ